MTDAEIAEKLGFNPQRGGYKLERSIWNCYTKSFVSIPKGEATNGIFQERKKLIFTVSIPKGEATNV